MKKVKAVRGSRRKVVRGSYRGGEQTSGAEDKHRPTRSVTRPVERSVRPAIRSEAPDAGDKKRGEEHRVVYGFHAVLAVLRSRHGDVQTLCADINRRDKRMGLLLQRARESGVAVQRLPKKELDGVAQGVAHQGVVALCSRAPPRTAGDVLSHLQSLAHAPLVLVLDGVQDPHNLGACLRSANATAVDAVVLPSVRSCGITPAVAKTACGAEQELAIFYASNLVRTLCQLQEAGLWVVGTCEEAAANLYDEDLDVDLAGPLALVAGGEGGGMRSLVQKHCDAMLRIPMSGSVSSLNVSVAVGVVLFECVRRRHNRRASKQR